MQILFAALEEGMLANFQEDVQVAGRSTVSAGLALVGEPDPGAFIHSGGNSNFQLTMHLPVSLPATLAARITNDLPCSITGAAGAADREETLLIQHLATAMTSGTTGGLRARFR